MTQTIDLNKLSQHVNQLFVLLCQFETVLNQESTILKSSDLSSLSDITLEKESLTQKIDLEFQVLNKKLTPKIHSLNELLESDFFQTFPTELQKTIQETTEKIVQCSDQNLANGMSIQALSNINQTVLQLFSGQNPQNKTYSASGESQITDNTSRTLGKA